MINEKAVRGINRNAGFRSMRSSIAGNTLISILFFMLVLGLIGKPAMDFYESWKDRKAITETNERLEAINLAISNYVTANGRYPCPASMTAPFDTATPPLFGVEQAAECDTNTAGTVTTRSEGKDGVYVRAGAVPVRTLGLPDLLIADGYGHRFIYTVTEQFAGPDPTLDTLPPAIMLIDDNNNVATRDEGNIIFAVTSVGDDITGAYSMNGIRLADCDPAARSYENCNMDATLKNTVNKSLAETNQKFTQNIRFKTGSSCVNSLTQAPLKMAYLLDTSGSMNERANCPPKYTGHCDRMDAAHWAMRRVIKSRQVQTENDPDLKTDFSGFIGNNADSLVTATNISISPTEDIENRLSKMCPNGNTPLGEHIDALARRIGPGESVDRPNAVLVISDGYSNSGEEPINVAKRIYEQTAGKLVVHIIDIGNNPRLADVARATSPNAEEGKGGQYFQTDDPQTIIDLTAKLSGTCQDIDIPEPVDQRHC
jgi:type II secretory pathway pseudopilin PulG